MPPHRAVPAAGSAVLPVVQRPAAAEPNAKAMVKAKGKAVPKPKPKMTPRAAVPKPNAFGLGHLPKPKAPLWVLDSLPLGNYGVGTPQYEFIFIDPGNLTVKAQNLQLVHCHRMQSAELIPDPRFEAEAMESQPWKALGRLQAAKINAGDGEIYLGSYTGWKFEFDQNWGDLSRPEGIWKCIHMTGVMPGVRLILRKQSQITRVKSVELVTLDASVYDTPHEIKIANAVTGLVELVLPCDVERTTCADVISDYLEAVKWPSHWDCKFTTKFAVVNKLIMKKSKSTLGDFFGVKKRTAEAAGDASRATGCCTIKINFVVVPDICVVHSTCMSGPRT